MSGKICINCHSERSIEEIRAEHPNALSCCPERDMVDARAFYAGLKLGYGNSADVALMMKPDGQRILDALLDLADTTLVPPLPHPSGEG